LDRWSPGAAPAGRAVVASARALSAVVARRRRMRTVFPRVWESPARRSADVGFPATLPELVTQSDRPSR
jgi:hypothetical protein